jgi:hypothetical protein
MKWGRRINEIRLGRERERERRETHSDVEIRLMISKDSSGNFERKTFSSREVLFGVLVQEAA